MSAQRLQLENHGNTKTPRWAIVLDPFTRQIGVRVLKKKYGCCFEPWRVGQKNHDVFRNAAAIQGEFEHHAPRLAGALRNNRVVLRISQNDIWHREFGRVVGAGIGRCNQHKSKAKQSAHSGRP